MKARKCAEIHIILSGSPVFLLRNVKWRVPSPPCAAVWAFPFLTANVSPARLRNEKTELCLKTRDTTSSLFLNLNKGRANLIHVSWSEGLEDDLFMRTHLTGTRRPIHRGTQVALRTDLFCSLELV